MESVERKIDLLVTTISALTNSVNKLVGGIEAKEEKVTEQSKKSSVDLNGKKRRNDVKRHEEFIPDIGEIVKLAYSNSFKDKMVKRNENDIGSYMVANELKGDKKTHLSARLLPYKSQHHFHSSSPSYP